MLEAVSGIVLLKFLRKHSIIIKTQCEVSEDKNDEENIIYHIGYSLHFPYRVQ